MENFKPPAEMSFSTGNVTESWKRWFQKFNNYMVATEKDTRPDKTKIAILLNLLGDEGVEVFNTFKYENEETSENYNDVINKFELYCVPRQNVVFERYKFFSCSQQDGQTMDSYLTQLKTLASSCEFGEQEESLVRDRIVLGIRDSGLQERLLREPNLTLKKAAEFIRAFEVSKEQLKTINYPTSSNIDVDAVQSKKLHGRAYKDKNGFANKNKSTMHSSTSTSGSDFYNCGRCGRKHKKMDCPAYNKLCNLCKQKNHFALMCTNKKTYTGKSKKVNEIVDAKSVDEFNLYIDTLNLDIDKATKDKAWCKTVSVEGNAVKFKLDTGAEANILPLSVYKNLKLYSKFKLIKSNVVLVSYGNHKLMPEGQLNLKCSTDKYNDIKLLFEIVDVESKPILGLSACEKLNLIKRVDQIKSVSKENILCSYADVFKGLGQFPGDAYHIEVKDNVNPIINAPRRVPQALHQELGLTLAELDQKGIISQVNKPTDWVSSLVIVEKPNGKLRICLDPRNLNKAIKREHHVIPSSDEIIGRLEGKQFFSVLDLKEGFWQVPLDEPSSDLCTFNSPFGRYKFNRLPFGIVSAPEVFQKRNQRLFGDIQGVEIYFDDLIIAGTDKEDHDKILIQVLERAKENNVKFNPDKFQFRVNEVTYMGHIISKQGIKADLGHIRAITKFERPSDKTGIRRLLGMLNFLSKFLPNVSKVTAPLRELLKNNVEFQWAGEQEQAFDSIKKLVSSTPVLKVFNSSKEIVLQCDSSKDGLGACLMQDGHPISFASRSLTETEKQYAQIEKELLAVCFAFQKYHNFVYGHKVLVESDHKPLTSIVNKPINKISSRLQKMLLKLLKYDFTVKYLPGSQMYLADALSRAYLKDTVTDDPEMLNTVHSITKHLPMSKRRMDQFRKTLQEDIDLKEIVVYCKEGWPDKSFIPKHLKKYYKLQNDLFINEGLLFLNDKIVVPQSLRKEMLALIHESHLGMEKCKSRAREIMYWPGISQDIEKIIAECAVCEKFRRAHSKEPLQPHDVPQRPCQKIGVDLMFFKNSDYLVVIDYFTKWIEVEKVKTKTIGEIVPKLELLLARFGVPETIVCDNVPFNSHQFKKFAEEWDIECSFISPHHSQSNGMVEKAVGIAKAIFKKAAEDNRRPAVGLLEYRNTPISGIGLSPAQLMFSRRLRTKLPVSHKLLDAELFRDVTDRLLQRQQKQKQYFDRGAKQLQPLKEGDHVYVRNGKTNEWEPATIMSKLNPRSYNIKTAENRILTRNRKFLRKTRVEHKSPYSDVYKDVDFPGEPEQSPFENSPTMITTTVSSDNSMTNSDCVNNTSSNVTNCQKTQQTKSGRICKRPAHLKEFLC